MEFTKQNVAKLNQQAIDNNDGLMESVTKYVLEHFDDCYNPVLVVADVIQHGCISGCVSELTYYSNTVAYYKKNQDAIITLLYQGMYDCGVDELSEFLNYWDKEDPLALYQYNQNILAWFGFEETMRNFAREFEEFEELI